MRRALAILGIIPFTLRRDLPTGLPSMCRPALFEQVRHLSQIPSSRGFASFTRVFGRIICTSSSRPIAMNALLEGWRAYPFV